MELLTEIIGILVGGVTEMAQGIGSGLSAAAQAIFIKSGEGGGLSVFGTLIVVFAAISLAMGLCRLIYQFVTSFGARNN